MNDSELVKRSDEIVARTLKEEPLAAEFGRRFPKSQHFISYITGRNGRPTWNSKAPLFGRYVVQMKVRVNVNRDTGKVQFDAAPAFELREVTSIAALPDGRQEVSYGKTVRLTADDWNLVEANGGDFGVLGIDLKKDQPVAGFADVLRY